MITLITLATILYLYATYRLFAAKKKFERRSILDSICMDDLPDLLMIYWGVFSGLIIIVILALMIKLLP